MGLNVKTALLAGLVFLGVGKSFAGTGEQDIDRKYLTVNRMEVREITVDVLNQQKSSVVFERDFEVNGLDFDGQPKAIDPGKVIGIAKDLVALGEDIYKLVNKGRPTNTTKYAPISVVPKAGNGEPIDVMETENWQMPVKRTYEVLYENLYGMDVVKFRYSIIYSYGGSFDGKGAYLTAVQVVPESVSTLWGYDFSATMKLGGIQNMATRSDPVAAATVLLEYTVGTILKASNEVRTFFVTGKGGFKLY